MKNLVMLGSLVLTVFGCILLTFGNEVGIVGLLGGGLCYWMVSGLIVK